MNAHAFAVASAPMQAAAGRMCPADYAYPPSVFARTPEFTAETLYVVGGLYGNLAALAAIERLAARETDKPAVVFNGDVHWFDAEPDWFAAVERGVAPYRALRGNVETEIARESDIGAGCGCAYPETVNEDAVQRSNAILGELRAQAPDAARTRLRALPMHLVAQVGALRVGIVHGDAQALAGWRFDAAYLDDAAHRPWLSDVRAASRIDVFASTHTCTAVLRDIALDAGRLTVVNNGAAGMANFAATTFGVVTRIATTPSPHPTLYGVARDGVHIDAIAVEFDLGAFLDRFLRRWPEGSPAHASYHRRIVAGPDYSDRAGGRTMRLSIVIPTLNEAAGIAGGTARARAAAGARLRGYRRRRRQWRSDGRAGASPRRSRHRGAARPRRADECRC